VTLAGQTRAPGTTGAADGVGAVEVAERPLQRLVAHLRRQPAPLGVALELRQGRGEDVVRRAHAGPRVGLAAPVQRRL
jgi:hypothetical protein